MAEFTTEKKETVILPTQTVERITRYMVENYPDFFGSSHATVANAIDVILTDIVSMKETIVHYRENYR